MRLSKKTEYALRALIAMAQAGGASRVPDLSKAEAIPEKFLEQIFLTLRHAGILTSRRGVGGGYSFRIHPETLAVGTVIEAIEGPLAPLPCSGEVEDAQCSCPNTALCPIRPVMVELRVAMSNVLDGKTIDDLARANPSGDSLHFDI
jgi:Rrf2 family protein